MIDMIDVQATIIGMMANHPELYKSLVVKPTYFTDQYKPLITAMIKSMDKNKAFILEHMVKEPFFDIEAYMRCQDIGFSNSVSVFNKHQAVLIDKYKIRSIEQATKKLTSQEINLDEYLKSVQEINQLGMSVGDKLSVDLLMSACNNDKKNLWFSRFLKLGGLLRLKENDFMILAGGTGLGKSGFAVNLAIDLAKYYRICYFNLEMVPEELYQRFVSSRSEIALNMLPKMNELDNKAMAKITDTMNYLSDRNITVINGSQTINTFRSYIASHTDKKYHTVVFIDHIGLLGASRQTNSYERATEVAKELRKISLDYNCTIIGLCQLNREAVKKQKKPSLSMLRDSGEIEQSASKVVFVWEEDGDYSIIIEKNRAGKKAIIPVVYDKDTQSVYEHG